LTILHKYYQYTIVCMILYNSMELQANNNIYSSHGRVERGGLTPEGRDEMQSEKEGDVRTSIQITPETRDRLFRLKFRRTYDQFLSELCDLYEQKDCIK
jgi:hypothetical protein